MPDLCTVISRPAKEESCLPPYHIKGVSSGGIVTASIAPWTPWADAWMIERVRSIKRDDFYSYNKELGAWECLRD